MSRALFAAFAVVVYAAMAIVRASNAPLAVYGLLLPALLGLGVVFRATETDQPVDLGRARKATRIATTAAIVALAGVAAWHVPEGRLAATVGCAVTTIAGLVAIGRVRAEEGLVARLAPATESTSAKVVVTLGWMAALVIAFLEVFLPDKLVGLPRESTAFAASAAALGSAAGMLATGTLELARRRLELGAVDRLRAFATLAAAFVAIAVLAAALRLVPLAALFVVTAVATGLVACAVAVTTSPETVGRLATHVAVLGALAVAPAIILAAAARQTPLWAPPAVFGAAMLAALGGLVAPWVSRKILPRTEPWTRAFEAAADAAMHPDPEPALERALLELRGLSSRKLEAPCLFRFDPGSVMTVDLAGYVRTEEVSIPSSFADLAKGETDGVVTRDALDAAAVRRPDVRPALSWLDDRRLRAVAVIREDDLAIGMLGLPRGDRLSALTLAEVRALGRLARFLGAQLASASKLARARLREHDATQRAAALEAARDQLGEELAWERRRGEAVCRILASRARTATYSPAARLAIESLELHGKGGRPLSLIVPPGMDPLPYLAVFHLASERKSSALYVVDGRNPELTDLERWRSPTDSPFVESEGGTLAIIDPHLLPRLVQAYVAAAHDAGRDKPRPQRPALAIVIPRTLDALVARDALDDRFADSIGDRAIAVPSLAARPEDLRALVLDKLTKLGLDAIGRPYGIEPAALAMLAEHDWPGNDVELEALLVRVASAIEEGDLLRKRDFVRAGFAPLRGASPSAETTSTKGPRMRAS